MGSCFEKNYYRPYNLIRCVSCATSYHLNALCIPCQTGNYLKASKQAWPFSFHCYCSKKHNYVVGQGNLFSLLVCFCCLKLKRSHRLEKENTRLTLRHTTEASAENIFLEKTSGHWTSFMLKASNLIQTLSRLLCSFGGNSYYPFFLKVLWFLSTEDEKDSRRMTFYLLGTQRAIWLLYLWEEGPSVSCISKRQRGRYGGHFPSERVFDHKQSPISNNWQQLFTTKVTILYAPKKCSCLYQKSF